MTFSRPPENDTYKPGKRKLIAALAFTACVFVSGSLLVWNDKVSGAEFVQGVNAASYVVIALLGANVIKAGIEKMGDK